MERKIPELIQQSSGLPPTGPEFTGTGGQLPPPWFQTCGQMPHRQPCGLSPEVVFLQWTAKNIWGYSWALIPRRICLAKFWTPVRSTASSFFPVSSFWSGKVCLMFAPYILEIHNLSDFTGSWLQRNSASRWTAPRGSPIYDVRWYLDETFNFRLLSESGMS